MNSFSKSGNVGGCLCHGRCLHKAAHREVPIPQGPAPRCTPTAAPAQCFLFCESHFDCHVFAFISFPALYMTHPQQDGGARAELGCPGAAFLTHQPCFGQLSGRQSHGEERFSRLQELTCCACVSWAECSFAGQGCKGSHTLPIQETEMLFPLESDGGSFHLLRV